MADKITNPYEFLARWDESTGAFKGYHFKTITTIMDGKEVLAAKESGAMNAKMAEAAGFPLKDILARLQVDALQAVSVKDEQIAVLTNDNAKLAEQVAVLLEQDKPT